MKKAQILGFIALKGGVGKSTLVSTLGSLLASRGYEVLVVDGSFSSPHLALYYGLFDVTHDVKDVLAGRLSIKEAIRPVSSHLSLLPCSWQSVDYRLCRDLRKHLTSLRFSYDIILLDSAPVLDEELVSVMMASDSLFVVSTPDHVTLSSTLHAVTTAKQRGVPLTGLVLNKLRKHGISVKEIEEVAGIPVVAQIPYSLDFKKAVSVGSPLVTGSAVQELQELAAALMKEEGHASGKHLSLSAINRIMMMK